MWWEEVVEKVVARVNGRVLRAREAHDLVALMLSREAISTEIPQYSTRFSMGVGCILCTCDQHSIAHNNGVMKPRCKSDFYQCTPNQVRGIKFSM